MPRFHLAKKTKYGKVDVFMLEIGGEKLEDEIIVVEKVNNHFVYSTYTTTNIKDFFIRKYGISIDDFENVKRSVYLRNLLKKTGVLLSTLKKFVKNKVATLRANFFGKNYLFVDREFRKIYTLDTFEELVDILINEYKIEIDRNAFLEAMKKVNKIDNRNLRQYFYYALYKSTQHKTQEEFCQRFGITRPALVEIVKKIENKSEIPKIDKKRLDERLRKVQEKLEEIKKRLEKWD